MLLPIGNCNRVGVWGGSAGGHLARGTEALKDAQLSTILSFVLGAAAGIAGGGDAAAGVLSAGQHVAQRSFLSFMLSG